MSKLSQVFLHNERTLERIAEACKINPGDIVFEIGGGRGELTKYLVERAERVITCELDEKLLPYLRELDVEIVNEDVMQVSIPDGVSLIVGNIPYHLSSEITEKILRTGERCVILYQEEFAERLVAEPGSGDYSRLTILARFLSNPRLLFNVSRHDFTPTPRVNSTLVEFTPKDAEYDEAFFHFVKILFQFKNKKVRNALISGRRLWAEDKSKSELRGELTQFTSEKVYTLSVKELKAEFKKFKQVK